MQIFFLVIKIGHTAREMLLPTICAAQFSKNTNAITYQNKRNTTTKTSEELTKL